MLKMSTTQRNCDYCQKKYFADNRNLKRGWGLCCSKSCASKKREKEKKDSVLKYEFEGGYQNIVKDFTYNLYRAVDDFILREIGDEEFERVKNGKSKHTYEIRNKIGHDFFCGSYLLLRDGVVIAGFEYDTKIITEK